MKTSTIAAAKNNLSHLINQLEFEEPIHLTRYGKPVAVVMSESQYQALVSPPKSLNLAILNWREQLDEESDVGLTESELNIIRKESSGRDFTWAE
ncbi:prevent-host-death family protein [Methyloprofundus sedimenti]|uniref:Antitoxin n=1 Tax=Methyloprofundus sedimenti TaxID=1420851 RepID=A0A1V8M4M8_9GAMM|nr:type II toxin-antitoxin system Phd/YefM family antitoxin [Methyloprofundus sedimenti]OQK16520.1 prevent-host-death family protein [Methyloprofundus sedimenti]